MRKLLTVIALSTALLAVLLAGCGGGDDEETTTEALNKAEFIVQGDEICTEADKEIEAGANAFAEENEIDTANPTDKQSEEVVLEVFVPSVREQAEAIDELGAPAGDEAEVEAIVASLEAASDELEDDPSLLFGSDNPMAEASELAVDFGFTVCGQ